MDALTTFGLISVSAMLVCYALEDLSHWYVLGFAGACGLGSAYGFLQGVGTDSSKAVEEIRRRKRRVLQQNPSESRRQSGHAD